MSYSLRVKGETVKVYKKMFMETLDVENTVISAVISKSRNGVLEEEKRGGHGKQKKFAPGIKEGVRRYIIQSQE